MPHTTQSMKQTMWLLNFTNISFTLRESNQFCSSCTASCTFKVVRMSENRSRKEKKSCSRPHPTPPTNS